MGGTRSVLYQHGGGKMMRSLNSSRIIGLHAVVSHYLGTVYLPWHLYASICLPSRPAVACVLEPARAVRVAAIMGASDDTAGEIEWVSTLNLRIISVFVVFVASLLGTLPPFLLKDTSKPLFRILKALSSGVILSLALVHVLPDSSEDLEGLWASYPPLAGACSIAGVLVMLVTDHCLMSLMEPEACVLATSGECHGSQAGTGKDSGASPHIHTHACVHMTSAASVAVISSGGADRTTLQLQISAYLMELGCVFHSVLIGISLGVVVSGKTEVVILMVAISLHQFLEGLGLGAVVVAARFSRIKSAIMALSYAVTTPLGIVIGIALSSSYIDPRSTAARAVQGSLNGVASGMLLYIAIIHLIAEQFSSSAAQATKPGVKLAMMLALAVGAAGMCVLAIWA